MTSLPCIFFVVSTFIDWSSPACVSLPEVPAMGSSDLALNVSSHLQDFVGSTARGRRGGVSIPELDASPALAPLSGPAPVDPPNDPPAPDEPLAPDEPPGPVAAVVPEDPRLSEPAPLVTEVLPVTTPDPDVAAAAPP